MGLLNTSVCKVDSKSKHPVKHELTNIYHPHPPKKRQKLNGSSKHIMCPCQVDQLQINIKGNTLVAWVQILAPGS